MPNPRLASRYAKALLDLAVEQNAVEAALQDVRLLDATCRQSRDFANMLRSPIIKADKKHEIVMAIVGNKMHTLTQAFLKLLVSKGREANLPEIAVAFLEQYKAMKNIKTVKLTTAQPLSDTVKQAIINKIVATVHKGEIEVTEAVDPNIIGGFILQMDDKLVDASVRRDLKDVKAQFQKNIYISTLFGN
ncbi:ATP synthase F1 subunit delta [Chitinophagaceae bacterium IBVUCB1]|nr:ATP synthase F1 subunit delta [Chitinophagaceae bacterium IBVUCB1]